MYSESGSRSCPTPRFSSSSSHRLCSGSRAAALPRNSGGDTSREPMEFLAPGRLAPPAGKPGGLTPRSRGGCLSGFPRVPSRPRAFLNPSPEREGSFTVLTTRAAARLAHLASTTPRRHRRRRRPRGRCPLSRHSGPLGSVRERTSRKRDSPANREPSSPSREQPNAA